MFSVLAVCLVVSSSIESAMSSSLTVPRSSVVLIGNRVEMKCSVNETDSTTWAFTAWNASTEIAIYLSRDIVISLRSRYTINKNISGHLIIDSVDLAHAGRYRCTMVKHSLTNDIDLTVLASPPNCSLNTSTADERIMQHSYLWMWCRIIYTGNTTPIFRWTKNNTKNIIVANTTTASNTRAMLLTATSSVIVQVHSDDNGAIFKCQITFQLSINTEVKASDYEYKWNYTIYGPRNLNIVRYGDRLECSADGTPSPTYRWTQVETNISTEGRLILLDASYDKKHTFQCTASNILGAENKNFTVSDDRITPDEYIDTQRDKTSQRNRKINELTGRDNHSGGTTDVAIVSDFPTTALAIGGSLLFLLIIAIIVSCVVYRKRLKDDTSDRPDVALQTDLTPRGSDVRMIAGNAVYAEVCEPKGLYAEQQDIDLK